MQYVGIRHMVKEQEQIVWATGQRLIELLHLRGILSDKPCACGHAAIHSDSLAVGAMPLSPTIPLGGFRPGIIVIPENVGERSHAQWPRIALVGMPRGKLHLRDRPHHPGITPKREPRPFSNHRA